MASESYQRKLTVILSADVEGYSLLMGEDEDATIRTLTTYRELMSTLIDKHRGRVVDSPGDNLMAEFGSVVDAVRCAVEIQEELRVRNAELPESRKMEFRIGINLGDVVQEGDRIYGDGINIAARVEGLADGGGICISGAVYDSIKNKLSLSYESMGEHTVKNIKEPVRVYRMRIGPEATPHLMKEEKARPRHWQKTTLAAVMVLVVVAGAWAIWNIYFRRPSVEPASLEKMAYPLPEQPSIAVLPFANMSDDPKQEYFSDGITEEIITALSKTPRIFVIARNSTFTYKGKPVKVQQVAEELGVRYVLKGSVRRAEDDVRITVQLVDAITGKHMWAERYDRKLEDIFSVQDEITKKIITELQVKLTQGEQARIYAKGTDNLEAYLKLMQVSFYFMGDPKPEKFAPARQLAEEAIALDPNWPLAYCFLGRTHIFGVIYGASKTPAKSLERAYELGQKALALDKKLGAAHRLLSLSYSFKKQYEKSIEHGKLSVEFNPSSAYFQASLGSILHNAGKPEESIPLYKNAIRLDPYARSNFYYNYGLALWMMGQYKVAIAAGKEARNRGPNDIFSHILLAATYIEFGRVEDAQASAAEVLRIKPNFTLEWLAKMLPWKNKDDENRLIEDLRKAGLPEKRTSK